ncbi:hypothetical protein DFH09DRAFT_1080592 [Mycena vulgaris]|nr:hypothetical protein DFH09DRAFT_1080592 [Mycena vulgaris]
MCDSPTQVALVDELADPRWKCENGRVDDVRARASSTARAYFLQGGQRENIHQPDSTYLECLQPRLVSTATRTRGCSSPTSSCSAALPFRAFAPAGGGAGEDEEAEWREAVEGGGACGGGGGGGVDEAANGWGGGVSKGNANANAEGGRRGLHARETGATQTVENGEGGKRGDSEEGERTEALGEHGREWDAARRGADGVICIERRCGCMESKEAQRTMIASHSSFSPPPPPPPTGTFIGGARSTFTRGAGGTHVPFAIASSTIRRWRRRSSERATIAEEMPSRRMSLCKGEQGRTIELGRGLRAAVRVGRGPAGGERGRRRSGTALNVWETLHGADELVAFADGVTDADAVAEVDERRVEGLEDAADMPTELREEWQQKNCLKSQRELGAPLPADISHFFRRGLVSLGLGLTLLRITAPAQPKFSDPPRSFKNYSLHSTRSVHVRASCEAMRRRVAAV